MATEPSEKPNQESESQSIVRFELQIPSKLHQQMVRICEMRRVALDEILLDLIDRFMPPDTRPELNESAPPRRIPGKDEVRRKLP